MAIEQIRNLGNRAVLKIVFINAKHSYHIDTQCSRLIDGTLNTQNLKRGELCKTASMVPNFHTSDTYSMPMDFTVQLLMK